LLVPRTFLLPHLPTLVVDQHRGHHTQMLGAFEQVSARLHADAPQAMAIVSARWETAGPFRVGADRRHATLTDDPGFGVEVRYDCAGHPALARALVEAGLSAHVRVAVTTRGVDSGVSVPMHFLSPGREWPVVPLSVAAHPVAACRAWGAAVRRALERWPERVAFVVGGVLSHNRHAWNLGRDVPEAREFDDHALDALRRGAWDELPRASAGVRRKAQPEAGLRHLEVLRGFLGADVPGEVLCYEPGPGVGAALVEFEVAGAAAMPAPAPAAPKP
jgi:aromatic ring-opening dioxygenase catalytic subunit (LigB family)